MFYVTFMAGVQIRYLAPAENGQKEKYINQYFPYNEQAAKGNEDNNEKKRRKEKKRIKNQSTNKIKITKITTIRNE